MNFGRRYREEERIKREGKRKRRRGKMDFSNIRSITGRSSVLSFVGTRASYLQHL
jgi:hypothetical protein